MKDQNGDGVKQLDAAGKATGRLITVQLNVTSDDQVKAAVETVKANLPTSIKVGTFLMSLFELAPLINVIVWHRDCGLLSTTPDFLPLVKLSGLTCPFMKW